MKTRIIFFNASAIFVIMIIIIIITIVTIYAVTVEGIFAEKQRKSTQSYCQVGEIE